MGRPPSPPKYKNGGWHAWHPGLKRTVRLNAATNDQAIAEQRSFYGMVVQPAAVSPAVPGDSLPASRGGESGTMLNLDNLTDDGEKKAAPSSAADMLSSWSSAGKPMEPGPSGAPTPPPPQPTIVMPTSASAALGTPPLKTMKAPKGLTPEQSAKIAGGLKKMVVNTNVVIVGAAIEMFGVVPAPLDREEIELLQLGWEMWLDELFLKAKLKPIHLVLVGNIMIIVSMWASGKRKPKADPKTDPAQAKAAPGHGATITPLPTPPKG